MIITRSWCTSIVLAATIAWPLAAQTAGRRLTVADAVALAMGHDPELEVARAGATAAQAAARIARAEWFPSLEVEAHGTRFQEPMIVAPLHAFDPSAPPDFNRTLLQSRLTLGYTVFDGGGRSARVAERTAQMRAEESATDAVTARVIERVVGAYLEVATAREIDSAQQRRGAALGAELARARQLFGEGRAARIDLLRAQAALATSRADRTRTRGALHAAVRELARQTGLPDSLLEGASVGVVTVVAPLGASVTRTASTAAARENNPEMDRARHRVAASDAGVRAARAAWLPALRLGGAVLTYGSTSGDFAAEWQGTLTLSYPIFTGGGRANAVGRATARASAAQAAMRVAALEVARAVDRASTTLEAQDAQRRALEEVVVHLTDVVRIARLALDVGTGLQTDYLEAEAELVEAHAALARARSGVVRARVALARLTGRLTSSWIGANLETEL